MKYGNLARERELQVIEWAPPFRDFTVMELVLSLWEGRKPPQVVIDAYTVTCRDLQRMQVLKGIATADGKPERFILNDPQLHTDPEDVKILQGLQKIYEHYDKLEETANDLSARPYERGSAVYQQGDIQRDTFDMTRRIIEKYFKIEASHEAS